MRLETPTRVLAELAWVYIQRLSSTKDTARKISNVKIPSYSCVQVWHVLCSAKLSDSSS